MPTTTPSVQPQELVAELMAHTRWSAERLEAHQRERLDALLRHAVTVSAPAARPIADTPGLRQFQAIVRPTALRIAAALSPEAPPDTAQRIEAAVHCALLDVGVAPPPIGVELVDEIAREPGPAGKLKTIRLEQPPSTPASDCGRGPTTEV